MQAYPGDSLEAALRNVFDFDVYKPETISKLADILDHHGYGHLSEVYCLALTCFKSGRQESWNKRSSRGSEEASFGPEVRTQG